MFVRGNATARAVIKVLLAISYMRSVTPVPGIVLAHIDIYALKQFPGQLQELAQE